MLDVNFFDELRIGLATADDIRTWCHGKHTVGAVEITNIIRSHHV